MLDEEQRAKIRPKYLSMFTALFMSLWLISDITAVKIVNFGSISLTGGFIVFPLMMALNSLIVEVYGYKSARQAIWSGCMLNLSYIVFINIVNLLPSDPSWGEQASFEKILIPNTRIIIASLISFWCSGFCQNYFMAKLKFKGKSLLLRIVLSSFIAITIDINIFFVIGFLGAIPFFLFKKVLFYAYLKKICCEILLLPVILTIISRIKRIEGFELCDGQTNLSPFCLDNVYDFNSYQNLNKKNRVAYS